MDDLVEQLRWEADQNEKDFYMGFSTAWYRRAADEIERLRNELAERNAP